MLVFISYPREFKDVAEALDAALRSHRIDTFLDTEQIRPADQWQLEIESNIEKADVFVMLYSPEVENKGRFFRIETERIRDASEKSLKRVIPVIFDPTKPSDLPEFFRKRQVIQAEKEGTKRDERDDYWIDQIVQELERLKAIWEKLKQRQIIARSALVLGAIIIVLLSISLFNTKEALKNRVDEEIQVSQTKPLDGEKLCRFLLGRYTLHQDYVFVETFGKDARSTAIDANWKATGCRPRLRTH